MPSSANANAPLWNSYANIHSNPAPMEAKKGKKKATAAAASPRTSPESITIDEGEEEESVVSSRTGPAAGSPRRRRQQSPHPADVLRAREAAEAVMAAEELRRKEARRLSISGEEGSLAALDRGMSHNNAANKGSSSVYSVLSSESHEVPDFSVRMTQSGLSSTESAEELRQLIAAMQAEFQRLRSSKLQAEARAEQLQTDLSLQRQEMEQHFESLSAENERLKSAADGSAIELGRAVGRVGKLEGENRALKGELARLQRGREVAEARAVAADASH